MKLVGLMAVRNEDWCLGISLRAALLWCDEVVVLNHASADRTCRIIAEVSKEVGGHERISYLFKPGDQWDEMEHRQTMLTEARRMGATHLAIIDADEVLCAPMLYNGSTAASQTTSNSLLTIYGGPNSLIRRLCEGLAKGQMLQLPLYNLRGDMGTYHANGVWGRRWVSVAFRDTPASNWSGDKFHARDPEGVAWDHWHPIKQAQGGVIHLWGASERRLRAKHAWYKITERLRWPDKPVIEIDDKYSLAIKGSSQNEAWGTPATWTYEPNPAEWLAPYAHLMQYLDLDAVPWQEEAVRRAIAQHGRERFAGLDLFECQE